MNEPKMITLTLTESSYKYIVEMLRQNVLNAGFIPLREIEEAQRKQNEGDEHKEEEGENVV